MNRQMLPRLSRHATQLRARDQVALKHHYLPRLEWLEDRVVPASADLGLLHFNGVDLLRDPDGHNYKAESGIVQLGFKPIGVEDFLPLVQIELDGENSNGTLAFDTNDVSQFTIENGQISAIVQGGTPSLLWKAPNPTDVFSFKLADLLGSNGMTLNPSNSETFHVKGLEFAPTSLGFARPTPGPSAYYTFDTVSGTTVSDTSGYQVNHDGTLVNGATVGTASSFSIPARPHAASGNKILALQSTSQFMNVVTSDDLQPGTRAFSVASWIYIIPTDTREQIIAGAQEQNAVMDGWEFGVTQGADHKLFVRLGEKNDPNHSLQVTGSVSLPGWHHVAFTYDGSGDTTSVRLYVDGIVDDNTSVTSTLTLDPDISPQNPVTFNAGNSGSATASPNVFHGYLDELVVWNGLLSSQQVTSLSTSSINPTQIFASVPGGDRIQLQGTVSFGSFNNILKALSANVTGEDYVVFDTTGVALTGLKAAITPQSDEDIGGFVIGGSISVDYNWISDTFVFQDGITFSSKPEGNDSKPAFDKVGANINIVVAQGNLTELGLTLNGGFNIKGLSVATNADYPLSFDFNFPEFQWEIWGGLDVTFRDNFTATALFGELGDPGLIIKDGTISKFDASISGDIKAFGAELSIPSPGLTIDYDPALSKFEMYGGPVSLRVPIRGVPEDIAVDFGTNTDPNRPPGLVFLNGQLQSLDIALTGDVNLGPFGFHPEDARVQWSTYTDQQGKTQDQYIVSGGVTFSLFSFKAGASFGNDPAKGFLIRGGKFYLNELDVELDNVDLGVFEIRTFFLHFDQSDPNGEYTIDISLDVAFPGGWEVGGSISIVEDKLKSIDVFYDAGNSLGLEIPGTGLSFTHIEASVNNIDHPSNIVVSGSIDLVYGTEVSFAGRKVVIFRAHGDFSVDKDELILDASAQLGAYRDENLEWQNVLGGGDMRIDLNWAEEVYKAHLEVDGLAGFFSFDVDFLFEEGKDIRILAEGFVEIPTEIPFIGGDKIGGIGIFFDHLFPQNNDPTTSSTILAAWLELDIFKTFDIGFEVKWDKDNNGSISLIGTGTVNQFESPPPTQQNKTFTYQKKFDRNSLPAAATGLTLGVDWSKFDPNVRIIGKPVIRLQRDSDNRIFTEAEFTEANNFALITDAKFVGENDKTVHIAGSAQDDYVPISDQYTLIIDITTDGSNPFPNQADLTFAGTYHIPKPTMDALSVPTNPKATFPLTLSGKIDPGLVSNSQVSVFVTDDPSRPGKLVDKQSIFLPDPHGTTWNATVHVPINDLFPIDYYVYAMLHQQPTNISGQYKPTVIRSATSSSFEPEFAVVGTVANQNSNPLTNWTIFLDLNRTGVKDPGEPESQTNDQGFYSFDYSVVPQNHPFDIRLFPLADDYVIDDNPKSNIIFDGQDTITASFQANEKSAIRGIVTSADKKVSGAVVYIDANHNGHLDPGEETTLTSTKGEYAFTNRQPGTYTVALETTGVPVTAYSVPTGIVGNQAWQYALGMTFDVQETIDITSLGIFDHLGDGFHGTLTATLYDRVTQKAVTSMTFTASEPGVLEGASRFKLLAQPITLYSGFQGMIVAEGFTNADPNGNVNVAPYKGKPFPWTTNAGNNQLTFLGGVFSQAPHTYPAAVDGSKPNPYAAGTFQFSTPALVLTSPAGGTHTVTIDNSGFDLQENNNFNVQPFSNISGTITAQQRSNGQLHPAAPQAGVTIHLIQNALVVGSATTDAFGNYEFNEIRPGNYTVQQVVPNGYRQITPFGGVFHLQQPSGNDLVHLPTGEFEGVITADLDGDGKLEAVLVNTDSTDFSRKLLIFTQASYPQTVYSVDRISQNDYVGIVPVPQAGSSLPGLLMLSNERDLEFFANNGGKLQNSTPFITLPDFGIYDASPYGLVAGNFQSDLNGIQIATTFTSDDPGDAYVIYYAQGGQPKVVYDFQNSQYPTLSAGDVNNDGFTDLFLADRFSGVLVILYSDGKGDFTPVTMHTTELDFRYGDLADLNGDGLLDLAMVANQTIVYKLQGPLGTFGTEVAPGVSFIGQLEDFHLADVNGDFRTDYVIITSNDPNAGLYVALNTGDPGNLYSPSLSAKWPLAGEVKNTGAFIEIGFLNWNSDGLFDLINNDYTNLILQRVPNTSTLTTAPISLQIQDGQNPSGINFGNAQLPKTLDHRVNMPPDLGTGNWTVRVNGERLEIRDSNGVLISSRHHDDLNSLTIVGDQARIHEITFDLSEKHMILPGGIRFEGSTRRNDTMRFLLGIRDDSVSIQNNTATINGLPVSWSHLDNFIVKSGEGNDTLQTSGTIPNLLTLSGGKGNDTYQFASRNSTIRIYDESGVDTFDFSQAGYGVTVDLSRNGNQRQRIGSGNVFLLNGVIENVIGSSYDDRLRGNSSNNLILGGAGNDSLYGMSGRDLLIGGLGRDVIRGGAGDDLLIGGTTTFSKDLEPLQSLLAEWVVGRDYVTRIKNLKNGSGSATRNNGNSFLNSSTLVNDLAVDILLGESGNDWFLTFPKDKTPDFNRRSERIN